MWKIFAITQQVPLGRFGDPASCIGATCGFGTGYVVPFPTNMVAHCIAASGVIESGDGKSGKFASGALKLKALVISPTAARRQALRFGTSAPNRVSRNRSIDV